MRSPLTLLPVSLSIDASYTKCRSKRSRRGGNEQTPSPAIPVAVAFACTRTGRSTHCHGTLLSSVFAHVPTARVVAGSPGWMEMARPGPRPSLLASCVASVLAQLAPVFATLSLSSNKWE